MSEHLPECLIGTECVAWCDNCANYTMHRIDRVAVGSHAGKIGPCLEHGPKVNAGGENKKQEHQRLARECEEREGNLFP